jgi:hypothetical protein
VFGSESLLNNTSNCGTIVVQSNHAVTKAQAAWPRAARRAGSHSSTTPADQTRPAGRCSARPNGRGRNALCTYQEGSSFLVGMVFIPGRNSLHLWQGWPPSLIGNPCGAKRCLLSPSGQGGTPRLLHWVVGVCLVPLGDQVVAGLADVLPVHDLTLERAGGIEALLDGIVGPVAHAKGAI